MVHHHFPYFPHTKMQVKLGHTRFFRQSTWKQPWYDPSWTDIFHRWYWWLRSWQMSSIILQCLSSRILRSAPILRGWHGHDIHLAAWLPPSDWEASCVWGQLNYGLVRSFLTQYCKNKKFKMKLQSPGRFGNRMVPDGSIRTGPSRFSIWDPQLGAVCGEMNRSFFFQRQFVDFGFWDWKPYIYI